jgi:hypothetical protein
METEMHILLALEDTGESRAIADKLVATHGLRLDAVFCRDDVFKCINDIYYSIIIADDSLFYSGDITRIIREAHTVGLYVPETEIILLSKTLTQSVLLGDDERVHGGFGLDVVECVEKVVFVYLLRRNIAGDDLAEQAVVHGGSSLGVSVC